MTTPTDKDLRELRAKAEAYDTGGDAEAISWNNIRFRYAANPQTVLSLLDRIAKLEAALGIVQQNCEATASPFNERVRVIAEVARRSLDGGENDGGQ